MPAAFDSSSFSILTEHLDGVSRVVVRGELDIATVPRLRDALTDVQASGAREVALDLSGVSFIDSTGLHLLLSHARGDARDTKLWTIASSAVRRVVELAGLTDAIGLVLSSEDEPGHQDAEAEAQRRTNPT